MLDQLNINLFLLLNSLANKSAWFDSLAVIVAEYLPLVFIAVLVYFWFSNKANYRNNALYAGYAAILGLAMNLLITLIYFHPRPFMDNLGRVLINHVPETSFPSDHTTLMLSISITLMLLPNTRKLAIPLTLSGIVGGLARVLCGIHYPFDILGSLIVAMVAGLIVVSLKSRLAGINRYVMVTYARIVNEKA